MLLIIENAEKLLLNEDEDVLEGFLEILGDAAREWNKAIEDGEAWDRPARPFHVIFQSSSHTMDNIEKLTKQSFLKEIWTCDQWC